MNHDKLAKIKNEVYATISKKTSCADYANKYAELYIINYISLREHFSDNNIDWMSEFKTNRVFHKTMVKYVTMFKLGIITVEDIKNNPDITTYEFRRIKQEIEKVKNYENME